MSKAKTIVIIGGGASGMTAAILLAEAGFDVTLMERQDRIGKKLLQTGNGRCNISHTKIKEEDYVCGEEAFVRRVLSSFDEKREREFLETLGISLCERDGCLYPVSRQASSVLDAYRFRLRERKVRILTDTRVEGIRQKNGAYAVIARNGKEEIGYGDFSFCILACGGMAGVYKEAEFNGYGITKTMGHGLTPVHPALTFVKCEGDYKAVAGVRADASCRLIGADGSKTAESRGEVQFTESGLSGIPIFQLSLHIETPQKLRTVIELDLMEFLGGEKEAEEAFAKRAAEMPDRTLEEFFAGWLQKKLAGFLIREAGFRPSTILRKLSAEDLKKICHTAKHYRAKVRQLGEWKNAQIQCGGIPVSELETTLESRKMKHVYLIGEMLDAAGKCGGYNLHFALATAHVCADAIIAESRT